MKENRKNNILMLIFVFTVMIFAVSSGIVLQNSKYSRSTASDVMIIEPDFADNLSCGEYSYQFTLPDRELSGEYVAFDSAHFSVKINIDGEKVYEVTPSVPERSNSTGALWNFLKLNPDDAGKECTVILSSDYGIEPSCSIYIGEKYDISMFVLKKLGPRIIMACMIMAVGIVLLFYTVAVSGSIENYRSLFFALYCIALSLWAISGSSVSALFINRPLLLMYMEHCALMVMPLLFPLFLREIYINKDNILWNVVLHTGVLTTVIRIVLKLAEIKDLRESLWITQMHIVVTVVLGIALSVDDIRKNKITPQHTLNYICLGVMFAAAAAELVIFRLIHNQGFVGMSCFLAYVVIMSVNLVRDSLKIRKRAREAKIYKALAYTDVLTGVFSRTAFMNDMTLRNESRDESKRHIPVLFMFDLNNLKKCNDEFGHENGDKYIKSVSTVISDVIGSEGRCYRIGGDEFSAIVDYRNQSQINSIMELVQSRVADLNKEKFVVTMSVAAGYAVYSEETDSSLDDTMKRADRMMYENKQKMKAEISR